VATTLERRWPQTTHAELRGRTPPELGEAEQEQLVEMLCESHPWQPQEIQHLIDEEFSVEYDPVYLSEFLKDLSLSYAIPRTKRPSRPDNAEEILDERVDDTLVEETYEPHNKRENDDHEGWVVDDDICTDGGTVVGFFDASHPQPYCNSLRMWYVDDLHHERPLVQIFEPAVGFCALNGQSVVSFPGDQTKEQICECLERIRDQNLTKRILLVLDNHFVHTYEYTRRRAHQLGIDLVFRPVRSPDLNPIEPVWKSLKWESSPLIVEG